MLGVLGALAVRPVPPNWLRAATLYGSISNLEGPLAQWQSTRLIPDGFRVRLLGGPPAFEPLRLWSGSSMIGARYVKVRQ